MTKPCIPLGLVFSRSGPYAMMAREMEKSALMAVDEVNASGEFDFAFVPRLRDPGGVVAAYAFLVELSFLDGRSRLEGDVLSLIHY